MIPSLPSINAASEMLELVRLLSTSEGLDKALGLVAEARAVLDDREADLQTRENAIGGNLREAERITAAAAQADATAQMLMREADERKADAEVQMTAAVNAAMAVKGREKDAAAAASENEKRAATLKKQADDLAAYEARLNARADALKAGEIELEARAERLRAALGA